MGNPFKKIVVWFLWLTGCILNTRELWLIFGGASIVSVIASFFANMPIPLLVIFCIGLIIVLFVLISYIYSILKRKSSSKSAIGLLIGKSKGGRVSNCSAEGKIMFHGKPEDINIGGLIGDIENTEVTDSTANVEIEYKED